MRYLIVSIPDLYTLTYLKGKMRVSVLRDSGCNSVLIKHKLVEAKEYTEKQVTCILADGTMRVCPVARINMITPFYVGQVEALIMDKNSN